MAEPVAWSKPETRLGDGGRVKVRAGDRYVDRPLRELIGEALLLPVYALAFAWAFRGGTGH